MERRLDKSDAAYKAREKMEETIKLAAMQRLTGSRYIHVYFQDGAVRNCERVKIEIVKE